MWLTLSHHSSHHHDVCIFVVHEHCITRAPTVSGGQRNTGLPVGIIIPGSYDWSDKVGWLWLANFNSVPHRQLPIGVIPIGVIPVGVSKIWGFQSMGVPHWMVDFMGIILLKCY